MTFGRYQLEAPVFGRFRLDGGAMFGSVPKAVWSRLIAADGENRILLVARSLLLRGEGRVILVDCGMGDKWPEKLRAIYAVENADPAGLGFSPGEVTDLVLTHLHFDHAGGVSRLTDGGLALCYPGARVHLQAANWETARCPNAKERASYREENSRPLEKADLVLLGGSGEIAPDVYVHRADGHTRGQQWVEVRSSRDRLFFPTDLVPTSRHLRLAFHMGYDVCAEALLREKDAFLTAAVNTGAVVVFQHDPDVPAARIGLDERGEYAVRERVDL